MKQYTVVTLFPELFPGPLGVGVTGRAIEQGLLGYSTISPRDYGIGRHRMVDDSPYGGGSGMVMKPEPLTAAIQAAKAQAPDDAPVLLMSPQGPRFDQQRARALAAHDGLILVCGRYEGIDERAMHHIDGQISVGDYVLSGGEIPAMIVLDAVARMHPGVLGNPESLLEESFGHHPDSPQMALLEYPHYTRPRAFEDHDVPEVLLSGNHEAIRVWRLEQSLHRTWTRRPDLLAQRQLTKEEKKLLTRIKRDHPHAKTTSPNKKESA